MNNQSNDDEISRFIATLRMSQIIRKDLFTLSEKVIFIRVSIKCDNFTKMS